MKVMLLVGSVGEISHTRTLLEYIYEVLTKKSIEVIWWDLSDKPLPVATPEYHISQHLHPKKIVREFARMVKKSDAFIFGSPLYHDSYSGVLKNALDNLPNEALLYKPVGLVSHSSNIRSCVAPCNQLRPVVRSLGGYAAHIQVGTTDQDFALVDNQLRLQSIKIKNRTKKLISEVLSMSGAIKNAPWID